MVNNRYLVLAVFQEMGSLCLYFKPFPDNNVPHNHAMP